MLETFQGWGAIFYPLKFVKLIEKICAENNILLCFDESKQALEEQEKDLV